MSGNPALTDKDQPAIPFILLTIQLHGCKRAK
jgi:hypothetical protein